MRADELLIARLQVGDESAFRELVTQHDRAMRRLALSYVQTISAADEVVQETWLAVIRGLAKFEGRSSLKTWIFRILVNRAQTRGVREQREVPFSALAPEDQEPSVDPDRFLPPGHAVAGYWSTIPNRFFELPEDRLLAAEASATDRSGDCQLARPPAPGHRTARRRGLGMPRRSATSLGLSPEQPARPPAPGALGGPCHAWRSTLHRGGESMSYEDLPCVDFVELVTDYLEGALPTEQVLIVERHLAFCAPCVDYLDQMRADHAGHRSPPAGRGSRAGHGHAASRRFASPLGRARVARLSRRARAHAQPPRLTRAFGQEGRVVVPAGVAPLTARPPALR